MALILAILPQLGLLDYSVVRPYRLNVDDMLRLLGTLPSYLFDPIWESINEVLLFLRMPDYLLGPCFIIELNASVDV